MNVLCRRAFGRPGRPAEVGLGRDLLGSPAQPPAQRRQGWEDVLWILVMSPEFQFVP
jgi:hypothetical protein